MLQDVITAIKDAHTICEQEPAVLLKDMPSITKQASLEHLPALRTQCLKLVCATLSWPEFNNGSKEGSTEKQEEDGKPPDPSPESHRYFKIQD